MYSQLMMHGQKNIKSVKFVLLGHTDFIHTKDVMHATNTF